MLGVIGFLVVFFGSAIVLSVLVARLIDGAEYKLYCAEERAHGRPHGLLRFYIAYRFEPVRRTRHNPFSFEYFLIRSAVVLGPIAFVLHRYF